jgi:hypothetical protein
LLFLAGEQPLFLGHRRQLTTGAAAVIAKLYETRRQRATVDELADIRLFVLQLVWCMFAESLGMLPHEPLERIVEGLLADPDRSSAAELGHLFSVLNSRADTPRGGLYAGAPYANGGLFASPALVHLNAEELQLVANAAQFDWRSVDPTIFGSLMEGCLGSARRDELGAHYTHEADILRIVRPCIVEPWSERIEGASDVGRLAVVLAELCQLRVLDPACGCGNFLYVSYREIRQLEHRAKEKLVELSASTGVNGPAELPSFHISQLHGIEIDEFTAMIARVTLWMGHKLVTDAFGVVEPVLPLVDLSGIMVGDALRIDWPTADVIVGNPPFNGSQHLRQALGKDYVEWLQDRFNCGIQDYCVYWFRRANEELAPNGRAGLVGTNSVSQNRGRGASLDYVVAEGGVITAAVSTEKWPGDAKVHVSLVNWVKEPNSPPTRYVLDGAEVAGISTYLRATDGGSVIEPVPLAANAGVCFQGPIPVGTGFIIDHKEAAELVADARADYARVVRRYMVGEDIADDPRQEPTRWIIDFATMPLEEASKFPAALKIVRERVKPVRDNVDRKARRENWWRFGENAVGMRRALMPLRRFIVGQRVGKRPLFVWSDIKWCPGDALNVFAVDDYFLGVLSSSLHTAWAWTRSSTLKGDIRYTPTTAFATFPWPDPIAEDDRTKVSDLAVRMVDLRRQHCETHNIGLTKLYNLMDEGGVHDLADCRRALDEAVASAYGWPKAIAHDRQRSVTRLEELNAEIANGRQYRPFPDRVADVDPSHEQASFYDLP